MSAELMKSKFVGRPSGRLWHRLSLNLLHAFLSNFSCCFPWAICPDIFLILKKKWGDFLRIFFFVFVNMKPYLSKIQNATPTNRSWKFQAFTEFSSQWSWQSTFAIFKILKIEILTILFVFVNMDWEPMAVKLSKPNSSYRLQPNVFKLVLNFPPIDPHKTTFGIFLKFWGSDI